MKNLVLLFALLALAVAQPEHPLFTKSEIMPGDGKAIPQTNPGFIGQNDKYMFFWIPINETTGTIVLYTQDSTGQYYEVNRITVPRMAGYALTANNEWFVSFNGANREVFFWQMNGAHQVVNNSKWAYKFLSGYANSIHLLSNNDMVLVDNTPQGYVIAIYPYFNGSWPTEPTHTVPCDVFANYAITDNRVAAFDKVRKVVSIYTIDGNRFTLLENVTVPFTFDDYGNLPWTYDGEDTMVFVYSSTKIGVIQNNGTAWQTLSVARAKDNDYLNSHFLWRGADLYIAAFFNKMHQNTTTGTPSGALFKFSKKVDVSDSWNITQVWSSTEGIDSRKKYITKHFWGFTVTDKAIYSLSIAYNTSTPTSFDGASQLLYTPFCYDDPIALTCVEKSFLSCDPVDIDVAELYTVDDDCAHETFVNGSATVRATFGVDNSFKTTINVSRFARTAQCEVTVQCNVEPVPPSSGSPSSPSSTPSRNTPGSNTPGSSQTSLATLSSASISFLGLTLLSLF